MVVAAALVMLAPILYALTKKSLQEKSDKEIKNLSGTCVGCESKSFFLSFSLLMHQIITGFECFYCSYSLQGNIGG